jgi:hypothetical protein
MGKGERRRTDLMQANTSPFHNNHTGRAILHFRLSNGRELAVAFIGVNPSSFVWHIDMRDWIMARGSAMVLTCKLHPTNLIAWKTRWEVASVWLQIFCKPFLSFENRHSGNNLPLSFGDGMKMVLSSISHTLEEESAAPSHKGPRFEKHHRNRKL